MKLQFVSPTQHAVLDFLLAGALLLAPTWAGFTGPALWLSAGAGLLNGVYSLLTKYPGGKVPLLPLKAHLALDAAVGVAMVAAGMLAGFAGAAKVYYIAGGVGICAAVAVSRRE